jgi:hypothetical protein
MVLANEAMPFTQSIGAPSVASPNTNGGNNSLTLVGSNYVLTSSNSTFHSDNVIPGDTLHITSPSVATYTIDTIVSNQQIALSTSGGPSAPISSNVQFYVSRVLSKTQTAETVASYSANFNSQRVVHVQPDEVGVSISGVTHIVPGYYLAAALGGMGAGYAVQQGFTNIGVAGIVTLNHSNYYFSRTDLNTMAAAGTCLFVQDSKAGIPYCRHELTTNMTALSYREMVMVKELDFLSYFYYDKLKSFIGSWNITPSTLNTIRQTLVASSELLLSQGLPQIGTVLLSYQIAKLEQDPVNTDTIDCVITVAIGTPLNYIDITLVV